MSSNGREDSRRVVEVSSLGRGEAIAVAVRAVIKVRRVNFILDGLEVLVRR